MSLHLESGLLVAFCTLLYTPVSCGQPVTPDNDSIEAYQNTLEGAQIFFRCNPGFVPAGRMRAVSGANGRWNTDPAGLVCTGEIFIHYDYRYTLNNVNGWGRNLMLTYFCNDRKCDPSHCHCTRIVLLSPITHSLFLAKDT